MIQRLLQSKNLVACLLTAATGLMLGRKAPFPEQNLFLELILLWARPVFVGLKYSYIAFLYTTPYIAYSILLSGIYIFALKVPQKVRPGHLPLYPDPRKRENLFLVIGEIHNARTPGPSASPRWLTIPERGLFTGTAIFGAIGSGKTTCCMLPFAEQILAYRAADQARKIGGLVLEVKGDFCRKVKNILDSHKRGEDYVEISLQSHYRYNPLHNDLDAYALAYSIASLLNNLFGKGKEPFWQQAYTNLVKFIILLHKVAYDYVTLFDVYECAISPDVLERKIHDAERRLEEHNFLLITPGDFRSHVADLKLFELVFDEEIQMYRTKETPGMRRLLETRSIHFECLSEAGFDQIDPERREQLQAVKRWYYDDWRRIEPKLRTSIIEGISVFLSLFDDNPAVKRTFCPPAECYDPKANADDRFGTPLPSFDWLIETGKVCALNFPVAMNPGLARALGVMMKLDFQRAVINRIPEIESHRDRQFRQTFFLCDEYQHFVTVGENEPTGDEKFFSLSRQPKCIAIVATQSISSLRSSVPGEAWRTLLQTFRTKIFLSLSDDFSARTASELCGREDQLKVSYNLSESGHNASISLLTGKAISHKANITASKSYSPRSDFRFDTKTFTELKNAQAVVIAYDGLNPMPPAFCYLKPYYNDPNKTYFRQLEEGRL
ncbi:MAG TPA: type IV secretion system DNA-binding domain-containing protein [Candidatus Acidoferrales bacterium]|nr:type IV secretion system DNA-binding domain-containing protein [Candidatus Acidoferrales bacterium]